MTELDIVKQQIAQEKKKVVEVNSPIRRGKIMEKIKLTQRLMRGDINSRILRNRIQQYNLNLEESNKDKRYFNTKKRLKVRGGRNKLPELIELKKRGFFK